MPARDLSGSPALIAEARIRELLQQCRRLRALSKDLSRRSKTLRDNHPRTERKPEAPAPEPHQD
jgi:hypothetical protein